MGARHADRGHRPQLSRADEGLEVQVSTGCGMPGRAAYRDDSLQDAAGALGQGTDPDRKEDSATRDEEQCSVAYQAGGLVSPDREYQLSTDDCAKCAADASDDYPQLAGIHPDVADRPSAVYRQHHVGVDLLSSKPEGAVSEDL